MNRICTIIAFLAALCLAIETKAQVGEPRRELSVGIGGGWALNKIDFNPTIKQDFHGGPTMGVALRYTCEKYFAVLCALQAEVNFAQLGWKERIETSTDTYSRRMNYIQLPLFARLAYGKERGGAQGYLLLGPQLGYCIGEKATKSGEWSLQTLGARPNAVIDQYDIAVERKFEYGIAGGLGCEFSTKSGHRIALEGRYFYGLSDIFNNTKKDPFGRSNNGTIYARISYMIDVIKPRN